jgi:hypothetical protein
MKIKLEHGYSKKLIKIVDLTRIPCIGEKIRFNKNGKIIEQTVIRVVHLEEVDKYYASIGVLDHFEN